MVNTDNSASATVLRSGRAKDRILASCSRQLWNIAATHDITLNITHKPGEQLVLADALSRRHTSIAMMEQAQSLTTQMGLTEVFAYMTEDIILDSF